MPVLQMMTEVPRNWDLNPAPLDRRVHILGTVSQFLLQIAHLRDAQELLGDRIQAEN